MSTTNKITWLCSYPKSGNTWFRIVLANLLQQSNNLGYINNMDAILGSPILAQRHWINKALGFNSLLLSEEEIENLQPALYRWYAKQITHRAYIKVHDAYTTLANDTPIIPSENCTGALYFIRNPLDVAISLAHHTKYPIDAAIQMMGNEQFFIPAESNKRQLKQKLLTWSMHVKSWVNNSAFNLLVLRYEDLFFKPLETFTQGMEFLNLSFSSEHLQQAIENTSFSKLQRYEKQFGFVEKPPIEGQFFRKGIVGDWEQTLTKTQIDKIIQDHGEVMQTYGYL